MKNEVIELENIITTIAAEISVAERIDNNALKCLLQNKKCDLENNLEERKTKIYEKDKRSSHSLVVTENEFEARVVVLMKLVRNSIMYLSLAIHLEERNKPKNDRLAINLETPLK